MAKRKVSLIATGRRRELTSGQVILFKAEPEKVVRDFPPERIDLNHYRQFVNIRSLGFGNKRRRGRPLCCEAVGRQKGGSSDGHQQSRYNVDREMNPTPAHRWDQVDKLAVSVEREVGKHFKVILGTGRPQPEFDSSAYPKPMCQPHRKRLRLSCSTSPRCAAPKPAPCVLNNSAHNLRPSPTKSS